jgi:alpha-L-arabinofuranosidase
MQICTLQDALYAAGFFHVLHRQQHAVGMANLCNLVNCLPAIVTDGPRSYLNPIYHAVHLYAAHSGPIALASTVEVAGYDAELVGFVPYLDCSVTFDDQSARLSLAMVNRNREADIACDIRIQGAQPHGKGRAFEINGHSELAANDFDHPEKVAISERAVPGVGPRFESTCSAHSVTVLEIPLGD